MRIRCAICDKAVDRVTTWFEPAISTWTTIAECHGDKDQMTLSTDEVARLGPDAIRQIENGEGVAFAIKRIPAE